MNKKAIILTLDVLFALLITAVFLSAILFNLRSISLDEWTDNRLIENSMGHLVVLEQTGLLKNVIIADSISEVQNYLNIYLQLNICAKVLIYDDSNNLLYTIIKTGCFDSRKIAITKRSFVANQDFYYVELQGWYREG